MRPTVGRKAAGKTEGGVKARVGRKERRKEGRKLAKAKKDAWKRKVPLASLAKPTETPKPKPKAKKAKTKKKGAGADERKRQRELADQDQLEVQRYAKKLGLNKRKRPGLPASFKETGLDYILELFEDDKADAAKAKAKASPAQPPQGSDDDDEGSFGEPMDGLDELADGSGGEETGEDEEDQPGGSDEDSGPEEEGVEREEGPQMEEAGTSAGAEASAADEETERRLRRRVRGLFNRVSAPTLSRTLKELLEVGRGERRGLFKEAVAESVVGAMSGALPLPSRMVLELGALVALLHSAHSADLSAHVLETAAHAFRKLFLDQPPEPDSKAGLNLLRLLGALYAFRVVGGKLVAELMGRLVEALRPQDLEALLFLLYNVGLQLRKEVPEAFLALLTQVQERMASEEGQAMSESPKVRFMFQALQAVKNNNGQKLREKEWGGDLSFEEEEVGHLRKAVRASLGEVESPLKMGWEDLMEVGERGRWWVVGSAFTTGPNAAPSALGPSKAAQKPVSAEESQLLDLARRYRMNSELRRRIFVAVMSGEDYLDGVERALKLKLSPTEERELVNILILCCLKEATFNPYYGLCLGRLCEVQSRFRLSVQFALWDRLKELESMGPRRRRQLGRLAGSLVSGKSLRPSVLRTLHMAPLSPALEEFLGEFLGQALGALAPEDVAQVFGQLVSEKQRAQCAHLVQGLLLFVAGRLRPSLKDRPDAKALLHKLHLLSTTLHQSSTTNAF